MHERRPEATDDGGSPARPGDPAAAELIQDISSLHASLLGRLGRELAGDGERLAAVAGRLAVEFGSVMATALGALGEPASAPAVAPGPDARGAVEAAERPHPEELRATGPRRGWERAPRGERYRQAPLRRRLEQLVAIQKRYGHPFGLVLFDAEGPGARNGAGGPGQEAVFAVVTAALGESIRLADEVFRLDDEGICVLAPVQTTVQGVEMAERLVRALAELEAVGGLRVTVSAGVVSCPEHGSDPDLLLEKADEAMWRARAVGQPVGVGTLQD